MTAFATDSEGGRVRFFEILSCVDIVGTRTRLPWWIGGKFMRIVVNMPRYIMSCQLAVVFAWGERTAAPRSLTLLLHAVLNSHEKDQKNEKRFSKCVLELTLQPSTAWESLVVKIVVPYCTVFVKGR